MLFAAESPRATTEVSGRVELPKGKSSTYRPAIVVWLTPVGPAAEVPEVRPGRFTLVQKNKTFSPHLLVIPVGSVVSFPNEDPFFHNVFSLFNGKRFDLGLYESGSTKDVVFSREGVSYIFCNIHPEMSAVVLALSTPLFAIADSSARFAIHQVPEGEYATHVWIEGVPQPVLDGLTRRLHAGPGQSNNLLVDASNAPRSPDGHANKFGKPYDRDTKPTY